MHRRRKSMCTRMDQYEYGVHSKIHEYEVMDAQKKKIDAYEMTGAQKILEYEMTDAQKKS